MKLTQVTGTILLRAFSLSRDLGSSERIDSLSYIAPLVFNSCNDELKLGVLQQVLAKENAGPLFHRVLDSLMRPGTHLVEISGILANVTMALPEYTSTILTTYSLRRGAPTYLERFALACQRQFCQSNTRSGDSRVTSTLVFNYLLIMRYVDPG